MNPEGNFFDQLKFRLRYGGMHIQLVAVNVGIALFIGIVSVFVRLFSTAKVAENGISGNFFWIRDQIFSLQTNLADFIWRPWGLFTYMFTQYGFLHLLFNMIMLYFAGKALETFFNGKRVLAIYLLAGLLGGVAEILAHLIFPALWGANTSVVGASGSVMGIFMALAFYKPNLEVRLFGIIPIKIIYLAIVFFIIDFFGLGKADQTAHFAHLGGAIVGMLSIRNPYANSNLSYKLERWLEGFTNKRRASGRGNMRVVHNSEGNRSERIKKDDFYNMDARERQLKTDIILDKITKSGYEALTKSEKDFLFHQSANT